jgi:Fe-S cluster assembly iron-binding protein IscA
MLRMTENAATLIDRLMQRAHSSSGAGLRIVVDPMKNSLSMGIAAAPRPDDAVVYRGVARIFLSPLAARRLQRRTLGAELTTGRSSFFLDD